MASIATEGGSVKAKAAFLHCTGRLDRHRTSRSPGLPGREDEGAWLAFLSDLEAAGICGDNCLQLIIHDGGAGLCAALNIVHFGAVEQRCLFDKLRNL